MTEQELRELKIKTLKLAGYKVIKMDSGYYRLFKDGKSLPNMFELSYDGCWNLAPDVVRSLDACAPLIEEMTGYEGCGHLDIIYHTPISVSVTVGLVEEGDIEEWVHDVPNPAATAFCLAYCKFKEQTKEVSTTKGEEQ